MGVPESLVLECEGLTSLLGADGELLAWLAATDLVEGVHADTVHRCRVQVHNVGLVDGGRDVASGLLEIPGIWREDRATNSRTSPLTPAPAYTDAGVMGFLTTSWGASSVLLMRPRLERSPTLVYDWLADEYNPEAGVGWDVLQDYCLLAMEEKLSYLVSPCWISQTDQ